LSTYQTADTVIFNLNPPKQIIGETMKAIAIAVVSMLLATSAEARTAGLQPELAGIGFLLGHWTSLDRGKVAETGGTSTGVVSFTSEVGGSVVLRKDHVNLYDRSGKKKGSFDILMMIYPEAGTLHADYSDGQHIIHYTSADVSAGHSVSFTSASSPQAPTFKLVFSLDDPKTLNIDFSMAPPRSDEFHPIATGKARKHI
jgi:hypothetical protein